MILSEIQYILNTGISRQEAGTEGKLKFVQVSSLSMTSFVLKQGVIGIFKTSREVNALRAKLPLSMYNYSTDKIVLLWLLYSLADVFVIKAAEVTTICFLDEENNNNNNAFIKHITKETLNTLNNNQIKSTTYLLQKKPSMR